MSVAAQGDPGRVAGQLAALAGQGATGALRVGGDPGGVIYLRGGRLAFAESAAVPDLGARLVNSRRLLPDQWHRAERDSRPDGCPGELLLHRGLIDGAEWGMLVRSAVLDALVVLALQEAAGPSAALAAITPGQARCAGPALTLDAGPTWAYVRAEAARLARHAVGPGTRLRMAGPPRGGPPLGRQAAAVLAQAGDRATIGQLAWRNGLPLYPVMDWAARLIQDGLCAITGPPAAGPPPGPGTAAIPPSPPAVPSQWTLPDPDLLARVLAGLQRLDTTAGPGAR